MPAHRTRNFHETSRASRSGARSHVPNHHARIAGWAALLVVVAFVVFSKIDAGSPPVAAPDHGSLVKIECPPRAALNHPCRAVYYIGVDGKRHAFPSARVYATWFGSDFSRVRTIAMDAMAAFPLGAAVTFKPGGALVQFPPDHRVFAVDAHRTLRRIPTETVAAAEFGVDWHRRVDRLSDALIGDYRIGADIGSDFDADAVANAVIALDADQKFYAKSERRETPIVLRGDETMEIRDTVFTHRGDIELHDRARLIIRRAVFAHEKEYGAQFMLRAYDESAVVVEDATIANPCNGSMNWSFYGRSSLTHRNVTEGQCNIWHLLTDDATATVRNYRFNGTFCERARGEIDGGVDMEVELCPPTGSTLDAELPSAITSFTYPGPNDVGIPARLTIRNSTVAGWGVGLQPHSRITLRNTPRVTIAVLVGTPWQRESVTLEGVARTTYEDTTWSVVDSTLRLVRTGVYGWELNVFADNALTVRNSDITGSTLSGGRGRYVMERSTADGMRASEDLEMVVRDSVITGDVVATGNSRITLERTTVGGRIIEEGNGTVRVTR